MVSKQRVSVMLGFALFLLVACGGGNRGAAPQPAAVPPLPSTPAPGPGAPTAPANFRVDISVGTTGGLFVSWSDMPGATYYNLEHWASPASGFSLVGGCSGTASDAYTAAPSGLRACRDRGLTVGSTYYYAVQACNNSGCSNYSNLASNAPVTSDCTASEMPDTTLVKTLGPVSVLSSSVDPAIRFLPNAYQNAGYAAPGVSRRNLLVVSLPGTGTVCGGIGPFGQTAEKLGFDVICVNYPNAAAQDTICSGDPACFGNVSQAKLDATGPCSLPNGAHCGVDPTSGQPFVNSNPADALTERIASMLAYLSHNGYNQNGTNWGIYLRGAVPQWTKIILSGWSQGGSMGTFSAYKNPVARVINLSAPPEATPVNGLMTAATYFTTPRATNLRSFYGLVSTIDPYYTQGYFAAVWQALGFTAGNNDAEVKLNATTPVGLTCNSAAPSHNFSTSAPVPVANAHAEPLAIWNEDVFKFMLID